MDEGRKDYPVARIKVRGEGRVVTLDNKPYKEVGTKKVIKTFSGTVRDKRRR